MNAVFELQPADDLVEQKPNCSYLKYIEIFFINNKSQSNIYCSAKLRYPATSQERFLVGTLKGKVTCLERFEDFDAREKFHSSHDIQARDVYFSYIPMDAEIISMDAFYRHQSFQGSKSLVVGLTLILLKPNEADSPPVHFLNVYNALEPGTEFDLDKLAQLCQVLSLEFTPYQLQHADILVGSAYETVFLLSGSDQRIHLFRENNQCFEEQMCEDFFPEFNDIPGRVMWMEVKVCDNHRRVSVFGCDTGYLRVAYADVTTNEVLHQWDTTSDGPISSVRLFTLVSEKEIVQHSDATMSPRMHLCEGSEINLLVTNAIEVSVVYLNVVSQGLKDMVILKKSDQFDMVTCSCITDSDCDGNNEIILGTYGQELLVYKWRDTGFSGRVSFDISWQREFPKPLLSVHGLDVMGDGMHELVVISLNGVHILQHQVNTAAEKLLSKLIQIYPNKSSLKAIDKTINSREQENESELDTLVKAMDQTMLGGGNESESELDGIINSITATNNNYNQLN